jgi:hypothetical protein
MFVKKKVSHPVKFSRLILKKRTIAGLRMAQRKSLTPSLSFPDKRKTATRDLEGYNCPKKRMTAKLVDTWWSQSHLQSIGEIAYPNRSRGC